MRTMWTVGTTMLAMALTAPVASAQDDFEWSGDLRSGQFLEVRGISGSIRADLARGSTAEVTATKDGRRGDFDEVRILMFEERGGVVICAVYGTPRRADSCDTESHGRHGRSIDVSVEFEVLVPEGVDFIGKTVSGDVRAEGLRSEVRGSTVSGDVVVRTTGVAHASTVSGDLEVEMGSLDWTRLDFSTVSGDVDLSLPRALGAEIEFESLSGDFRSDFDIRVTDYKDRFVGSEFEGRVGDGSRRLKLHTVSGDVTLRILDGTR